MSFSQHLEIVRLIIVLTVSIVLSTIETESLTAQANKPPAAASATVPSFSNKAEAQMAAVQCELDFQMISGSGESHAELMAKDYPDLKEALTCMSSAYGFIHQYKKQIWSLRALAIFERSAGERMEAIETLRTALAIAMEHDKKAVAPIRLTLAGAQLILATPSAALITMREMYNDPETAKYPTMKAFLPVLEAFAYFKMKDFENCIKTAKAAEIGVQQLPLNSQDNKVLQAVYFGRLAEIYSGCGQIEQGLSLGSKAVALLDALSKESSDNATIPDEKCHEILRTASIEHDHGEYAAARLFIQPCFASYSIDNTPDTFFRLMRVYEDSDPDLAIVFGKHGINVVQQRRRNVTPLGVNSGGLVVSWYEDEYRELAAQLIATGRLWEAKEVLDLLKDQEYLEYTQRGDPTVPSGNVGPSKYDAVPLVKLQEEQYSLSAKETLTAEERQRKENIDGLLATAKSGAQEFFDEQGRVKAPELDASASQIREREQEIASGLQKDLRPGAVAIYTLVADDGFHALLLTPSSPGTNGVQIAWTYKISRADLRKKIFYFHEALSDPRADPVSLGKELYRIIVGDLDKELTAMKATTVLWSLDDALRYIPMAALHDGQRYLVERFENAVYSGATSRVAGVNQGWKVLGAGVSKEDKADGLIALSAVPRELTTIVRTEDPQSKGVMPGRILLDSAFTSAAFRAGLHQGYPIVHVASHFVFDPTSDKGSFLLVGDGKLTLDDLKKNDDYTFQGIELLTLSACETAAGSNGDGREIDGLGFLAENKKGARSVLATLWSVYDVSTGELMKRFYTELSDSSSITKAKALQKAQLALLRGEVRPISPLNDRGTTSFSHPYFWAPFILLGNGY